MVDANDYSLLKTVLAVLPEEKGDLRPTNNTPMPNAPTPVPTSSATTSSLSLSEIVRVHSFNCTMYFVCSQRKARRKSIVMELSGDKLFLEVLESMPNYLKSESTHFAHIYFSHDSSLRTAVHLDSKYRHLTVDTIVKSGLGRYMVIDTMDHMQQAVCMDRYFDEVFNFFIERHIVLKEDWLKDVLDYLKTKVYKNGVTSISHLCNRVFEQWKYADLAATSYPSFEQTSLTVDAAKQSVTAPITVQVLSVVDIGSSFHSQLNKLTYEFVDNTGFEALPETDESKPWEAKPRRMIMLEVSDGHTTFRAIELHSIPDWSLLMKPGCKMLLVPCILLRRGIFMMKPNNCQLLGGDVDSLMKCGRPVDVMAKRLNTVPAPKRNVSVAITSPNVADPPTNAQSIAASHSGQRTSIGTRVSSPAVRTTSAIRAAITRAPSQSQSGMSSSTAVQNRSMNRSLLGNDRRPLNVLDDDDFDVNMNPSEHDSGEEDFLNEGIIEDTDDEIYEADHEDLNSAVYVAPEIVAPAATENNSAHRKSNGSVASTTRLVAGLEVSGHSSTSSSSKPSMRGQLTSVQREAPPSRIRLESSPPDFDAAIRRSNNRVRKVMNASGNAPSTPTSSFNSSTETNSRKRSSTSSSLLSAALADEYPTTPRRSADSDLFDPRKRPGSAGSSATKHNGGSPMETSFTPPRQNQVSSLHRHPSNSSTLIDPRRANNKQMASTSAQGIRQFLRREAELSSPPKKKTANQPVKSESADVIELSDDEDMKPLVDKSLLRRSDAFSDRTNGRESTSAIPVQQGARTPPDGPGGPFNCFPEDRNIFKEKFVQLNVSLLSDVINRMRFAIGTSRYKVQAIVSDIVDPLRIVDDVWTQKVKLLDESAEQECLVDNSTLTSLIGLSPAEALSIRQSGDKSRRQEGKAKLESVTSQMQRCDLLFDVEFFSGGTSIPVIRKVMTIGQALEAI